MIRSKWVGAIAGVVLMVVPASALAQTVDMPPLDLAPYVTAVADAHAYYTDPRNAEGSLNERLRKRNAAIRGIFDTFRSRREPLIRAHRQYEVREAVCENPRRGGHKTCYGNITFEPTYEVVPGTIGSEGSGLKAIENATPNVVSWQQRKTGKGTNRARVWATARLSAGGVTASLETEMAALRNQLSARQLPDDRALDPLS
jgi:hypothetical protein